MIIAQANGIVISAVTVFQRERALLKRERAKKMYGVSSYFLGKTASDMTNNVLLPVLYGLVVYWTAGFRPTFEAYLKFFVAFYLTLSTAQSMGLWMSIAIPNMQVALVLAPPITLFFMIMVITASVSACPPHYIEVLSNWDLLLLFRAVSISHCKT
jgi:ABC-type multidrug transport system permease subunit